MAQPLHHLALGISTTTISSKICQNNFLQDKYLQKYMATTSTGNEGLRLAFAHIKLVGGLCPHLHNTALLSWALAP